MIGFLGLVLRAREVEAKRRFFRPARRLTRTEFLRMRGSVLARVAYATGLHVAHSYIDHITCQLRTKEMPIPPPLSRRRSSIVPNPDINKLHRSSRRVNQQPFLKSEGLMITAHETRGRQ